MSDAPAGKFRRPLLQGALAVAATAAISAPWPAMADAFLKLGDIKGESLDAKHRDQIDILSFSQSWINPYQQEYGGGGAGAGKVQCGAITMMKNIDRSSPQLIKQVATGTHVPTATISFVATEPRGTVPGEYYTITLTEVFVSELSQTDEKDPNRIFEKLVLNAATHEFKYYSVNSKGVTGSPVAFKWDCKLNKGS